MESFEEIMADFDSSAFEPEVDMEFKSMIDLALAKNRSYELESIDSDQIRVDVRELNQRWQAYRMHHIHDVTVTGDVYLGVEYIEHADLSDDEFVTYYEDDPVALVHYPIVGGRFVAARTQAESDKNPRLMFVALIGDITGEDEEENIRCAIDLGVLDLPLEDADRQLTINGADERFQNHFNFVQYAVNSAADVCEATIHLKDAMLLPISDEQDLEEYRQYLNEYLLQLKYNEHIPYVVEICGAYEESELNNTAYADKVFEEATPVLLSQPILTAGFDDGMSRIFLRGTRLLEGRTTTIRIPLGSVRDIRDTSDFYKDFLKKVDR